jgi:hypothetical protein
MNLDPVRDKMKIGVLLKTWIKNGSLKVVHERDEGRRKDRPFVKGGTIINLAPKIPTLRDRGASPPAGPANVPAEPRAHPEASGAQGGAQGAQGEPDHDPDTGEVFEQEAAPAGQPAAGIPFMVTKDMRRRLNAIDFTEEQIDNMSPEMAWQILSAAK